MVTKILKWSRIQDSFRITPKIESLVAYAVPDIPSKFQKNPPITFWVILLTDKQTNRRTKTGKNITSLAEVTTKTISNVTRKPITRARKHGRVDITLLQCVKTIQARITKSSLSSLWMTLLPGFQNYSEIRSGSLWLMTLNENGLIFFPDFKPLSRL